MTKNTKLVYSTDPKDNQKCAKCGELISECSCEKLSFVASNNFVATIRIEKGGRAGKTVTVIDRLPKVELFLKDLTRELKQMCGVGGTYIMSGAEGVIEIQGDKRDVIRKIFAKKGFKLKG